MSKPRIWPATLLNQVRQDRYRQAEVRVFDLLSSQLEAGWTVFYSRPWHGLTPSGGERDGECDFVITHPKHGFLALEVKGGAISYDPVSDAWSSRDRDGLRHKIKNPVEQARKSKHELLKKVREMPSWPKHGFIRARHGVIFPDAEAPTQALGPDRPREIFCCRTQLPGLGKWIQERLTGGDEDEMGPEGCRAFERLLAAPFTLRVPLGHVLDDDDHAISCLTPQQFHILDAISLIPRVAIGGGAGTGKTIVAMEDAIRLARGGQRVLLTCLSPDLGADLRERLGNSPIVVLDFENLCRHVASVAKLDPGSPTGDRWAELLLNAASIEPAVCFDAIVVDEAQDFKSHWWIGIEALLRDPSKSKLHAFYDTNQRLYGAWTGQLADFKLIPIQLTRNLRNTRAIHSVASRFYTGLPIVADGPEGVSVQWVSCGSGNELSKGLEILYALIQRESLALRDIAILAVSDEFVSKAREALASELTKGLVVAHVLNFKGLERKVVLLLASKEIADESELSYVALSRPRTHLCVIGEQPILDWLGQ